MTTPVLSAPQTDYEQTLENTVGQMIQQAQNWSDSVLSPLRGELINLYKQRPLGTEVEGRSAVVTSEVMEAVTGMVPELLQLFFGPEHLVQFRPHAPPNDPQQLAMREAQASQQTAYINWIVTQEQGGFRELYDAFKDGLLHGMGVVKWSWDETTHIDRQRQTGLTIDQLMMLEQDPEVVLIDTFQEVDEQDQPTGQVTVDLARRHAGSALIEAVPPEEFIWTPNARDMETAPGVFHRRELTRGELLQMGVDEAFMESLGTGASSTSGQRWPTTDEALNRQPDQFLSGEPRGVDPMQHKFLYVEGYVLVDDGEGRMTHKKTVTIGTNYNMYWPFVEDWPVADRPFALFFCDPEPHTMTASTSVGGNAKRYQMVNSQLWRGMLDNLTQHLIPRPVVLEDQVHMGDVMQWGHGKPIRETTPGAYRTETTPFVGQSVLPVLAQSQSDMENTLGHSRAAAGLDPDVFQSTTKPGVMATISGARRRVEMVARLFAESPGMVRLFQGLQRLVIQHQDQQTMVELEGQWVPVDPRTWTADMRVVANVAIGMGTDEERRQVLMTTLQEQKETYQALGPENGVVTMGMLQHTRKKILELSGIRTTEQFWTNLPLDFDFPKPPPKKDPNDKIADAEELKAKTDAQVKPFEAQTDRLKLEAESFLKAKELEVKTQDQVADKALQLAKGQGNEPA